MALNNNPTANEVVKAIKDLEKPATTGNIGLVKPDGISITIDNDGTIRSQASGNVTSITAGTGLSGGTITTSGTIALSSETQASLLKADSAVQPGDLGTLASQNSIDYTSNQITNKPTIPTTTNELTNNSGFITNAVNNLTNYYKKTETYTQTEIDSLIANIKTITAEIVTSLPTASSTTYFNTSKKIYLVLANNDSDDFYNEYITILKDSKYFWEKIGDTKIDLTDYVKNTDYATTSKGGVVIVNNENGVGISENGVLQVVPATTAEIDDKTQARKPIVPNTLDYAIEKGLGANSLIWTDTEKLNARNTIGAGTSNFSGDYNDLTNKLTSINGLSGGTISSAITINGNVNGHYLIGDWLQATKASDNANWSDVWVNNGGWLYKRAKASFKSDLGIPDTSTLMTKENPTGTGTFNFTGNEVLTGNLQAAGLTDGTTTKTMADILASGKLYTTTGQNTDGPMTQKATTDALNGKMDWSAIKQSTGTEENVVMSQKATTDELAKKANTSAIPTKTSQLTNDSNFATTSQIPSKTSQLTNDSGFVRKDVIYDKSSADSSINWGYTSGLYGGTTDPLYRNSKIDFSKYKSFRFTINLYASSIMNIGSSNLIVEMGIETLLSNKAEIHGVVPYISNGVFQPSDMKYVIRIGNGTLYCRFYFGTAGQDNSSLYCITKIEGVY